MAATTRKSARKRGYTSRWEKCRIRYLRHNPLCKMCHAQGLYVVAEVVDHIVPHKGDHVLFWDETNWQALCRLHHDRTKQAEEARGYSTEIDASGWPVDERHPSNR